MYTNDPSACTEQLVLEEDAHAAAVEGGKGHDLRMPTPAPIPTHLVTVLGWRDAVDARRECQGLGHVLQAIHQRLPHRLVVFRVIDQLHTTGPRQVRRGARNGGLERG